MSDNGEKAPTPMDLASAKAEIDAILERNNAGNVKIPIMAMMSITGKQAGALVGEVLTAIEFNNQGVERPSVAVSLVYEILIQNGIMPPPDVLFPKADPKEPWQG